MPADSIVEAYDELEDVGFGFPKDLVMSVMDEFGFEGMEKLSLGALSPQSPLRLLLQIMPWIVSASG